MKKIASKHALLVVIGSFLLGVLALFAVHFVQLTHSGVHYHANFALYVDGERDTFDNFTFYEEIQACQPGDEVQPESRVHMHDMIHDVVHVHDEGVTWGHFFANLGYGLSDTALTTDDGTFVDGDGSELRFILNGEPVNVIANQLIGDGDRLLVNYGNENSDDLHDQFASIADNAHQYNETDDPGNCAGPNDLSLGERMLRALGIY